MRRKRNWKRVFKWAAVATAGSLVTAAVVGWMLFQRIPSWYQPFEVPPDRLGQVESDLTLTLDHLTEAINSSNRPFDFAIRQEQVNAWIAAREQMDLRWRHRLPKEISSPFVVIEPDGIRLAVTLQQGNLRTVCSAVLSFAADEEAVHARLLTAAAGALPLPRSQVVKFLRQVDERNWPAGRLAEGQVGHRPLPHLAKLYGGVLLPNGWIWPNIERPFKITQITCREGEVVIRFEPLPRQAGGSSESLRFMDDGSTGENSPGSVPAGSR